MEQERRQDPRVIPEGLAYINIEPKNGGIVLNVSNGGLCFRTVAPLQGSGTIRFWFSVEGQRIEADGELAWTDKTQKTGGLQFKALSPACHKQIKDWIIQSTKPLTTEKKSEVAVRLSHTLPIDSRSRPVESGESNDSAPLHVPVSEKGESLQQDTFFRGLVTGLLISTIVAAAFLFHTYRRQVGESLIRLGERFASAPQPQTASPVGESVAVPAIRVVVEPQNILPAHAPTSVPLVSQVLSQSGTTTVRSLQTKLEPEALTPATSPMSPTAALPMTALAANFNAITGELGKVPQLESADQPGVDAKVLELKSVSRLDANAEDVRELNSGVPLGKYFDIGKFRDRLRADETTNQLAYVGFHAIVIHKSYLWLNSYQVLVGPYSNQEEAQVARGELQSHGFKPRSLAKRSRDLTLTPYTRQYTDMIVPAEDFIISWETYSPDATVKFVKGDDTITTAHGKWVKRVVPHEYDAVVYKRNGNGSRTLLEIRLQGVNQTLVFPITSGDQALIF